ncbi:MAG: aminotransferase class I/II-fold pyridoxal phosphate-dependent enzyme [Erysipelotrichaceae bacterium]|nr:aminotransferase class I/II-fold pyridoxal phosphate-dependent enzyme [Erysipelotrichaceae bacterium]
MDKINLKNDYNAVGHPLILKALEAELDHKFVGYGTDEICARAKDLLLSKIDKPQAAVHFLVGGTPVNLISLSAFLRPHEAIIAPDNGHINVHETGSIEATGHKIVTVPGEDGKISAASVQALCDLHSDEHMVKPKLVFISQATEIGTIYSLKELKALREVCDKNQLLLYLDGARLPSALTASDNDASLKDIAALTDAFYLGGTKNGLLFGEALVIVNPALQSEFRYLMKQRGGMLAKGFLLGIQFLRYLQDDLFMEIAQAANKQADRLREGLKVVGVEMVTTTSTNQIFPIFEDKIVERLKEVALFELWGKVSDHETAIRFVTSWLTTDQEIERLLMAIMKAYDKK